MSPRPRMAWLGAALMAGIAGAGRAALNVLTNSAPPPTFGMRYGANPKADNGGQRSGAAAAKRSARKRRNIRKHPRGAA